MTNKDKRLIIESVGLCWHEWKLKSYNSPYIYTCVKCCEECNYPEDINLDPLDPADMYGKIWVAFKNQSGEFIDDLWNGQYRRGNKDFADILTSAPDLAQAMLEYIKEIK